MRLHPVLRFLPLVFLLSLGCGDGGSSGGKGAAKGGAKAGKKRPPRSKQRLNPGQGAGAAFSERSDLPFTEMRGYVVKGTDESSFRRCGSSRVYLARVAPPTASRFAQHYRWSAQGLLDPVYVVVMGRFVEDTVTIGENRYTGVVEIRDILIDRSKETPACPSPKRGSMINTG